MKLFYLKIQTMVLILSVLFIKSTLAQVAYQKHPRVIEMERQMTKDALDFLKSRFPDYPVIVTVAIDPLFRIDRQAKKNSENLPYFRVDEEEIIDEWDDPSLSNGYLLNRIKKIVVNVSVPGHLSDDEVAEIKQSITLNLNLYPARDNIEISRRTWAKQKEPEFDPMKYIWLAFGFFFLLFVCLLFAIWTPMRQIVKVLREGVSTNKNQTSASGVSSPIMAMTNWKSNSETSGDPRESSALASDVRFNDPIKIQSALAMIINQLSRNEGFPNLNDMVILDEECRRNPFLIGALLMEFPNLIREKIFSYSYGNHWMEALIKPGIIDIRMYEVLHQLNRNSRSNDDLEWQNLLIAVWRLSERKGEFFKSLSQEVAFSILFYLPKSMALQTARDLYPGSWAILLDPQFIPKKIDESQIMDLLISAVKLVELRTMSVLERFKQDKDLINFLHCADLNTEREIYIASPKESILHKMRPPFYKVMEASVDQMGELINIFSISDWAQALTNLSRSERKPVESAFPVKHRIRLNELIAQNELNSSDNELIGSIREKIAQRYSDLIELQNLKIANERLHPNKQVEGFEEGEKNEKKIA